MEILRFEEAPSGAPKRKKSSRSFLALGLVATLFGVSTAFATTTININNNKAISLGQGVNAFTACDEAIGLNPVTSLKEDLASFQFDQLIVGYDFPDGLGEGSKNYKIDSHEPRTDGVDKGLGCGGVDFLVKFYNKDNSEGANIPLTCSKLFPTLPETAANRGYLASVLFTDDSTSNDYLRINDLVAGFKCDDSAISFTIPKDADGGQTTELIKFLDGRDPNFFDHVTIETTANIDYTSLT